MTSKVGYIGLGLMGSGIARNLMKAGYSLVVHNRSQTIVEQLVSEGAVAAQSPREVAAQVDFIFTNLPDTPDVELVVLGENGILEGAHEGLVYIDNSTILPEAARRMATDLEKVGVLALDAPVSGGDIGARAGTLSIMVGGPQAAFERALPLFEAMGKTITWVGESGAGQIAKAANQIVVAGTMVAMAEALVLAQKSGVDPARVVQAISRGAAQCWALDNKPPKIFKRNLGPGFKAYMQAKDLKIITDTGHAYQIPLPQTAVALQLYEAMIAMGNGELDNSAIITVLEALAGVEVGAKTDES
ncbi:MAG TPA: NAD(P)-binding domain-containing protein [Aggregatilineaceae bacterium]|nr:NAD(P)-binding domain-containing protein [Aggregatilineaceae bacterium]